MKYWKTTSPGFFAPASHYQHTWSQSRRYRSFAPTSRASSSCTRRTAGCSLSGTRWPPRARVLLEKHLRNATDKPVFARPQPIVVEAEIAYPINRNATFHKTQHFLVQAERLSRASHSHNNLRRAAHLRPNRLPERKVASRPTKPCETAGRTL